jgi:colicin import membrane protein
MSTAPRRLSPPKPHPDEDLFRYGWRYVWKPGRCGAEMVPLTREDVLHPQEGDQMVHNDVHEDDIAYLREVFKVRLAGDSSAEVFTDLLVFWDVPGLRNHCPDVTVVLGVRPRPARWRSFHVAEEGVRPQLLIEITSPSTRDIDLLTKRRQYYIAGVPFYVIVDELPGPDEEPRQLRLLGYRRGARRYRAMPLNEQGRLWLEPVRLWLGTEDGLVACYDTEGRRLENYTEVSEARAAAEQRALELEAELRRLRGER